MKADRRTLVDRIRILRLKTMESPKTQSMGSKYRYIPFINTVFECLEMGKGSSPSYDTWDGKAIDECIEFCLMQTGADEDKSRLGFAYLYLWHYFFDNTSIPHFVPGDFPSNTFVASPTFNLKADATLAEMQLRCWLPKYTEHIRKFVAGGEVHDDHFDREARAAMVEAKITKSQQDYRKSLLFESAAPSIKVYESTTEILSPKPYRHLGHGIDKIFGIIQAKFAPIELKLETAVGDERENILKWLENTSSSEYNDKSNEQQESSFTTISIDTEDDKNAGFCGGYRRV